MSYNYPGNAYGSSAPGSQVNPEVQQWFRLVDKDQSGRISANELKSALANGQGRNFSGKACRLMIGMFDKDKKGTIDFEGFQALFNYVNAWIGVFRGFDHDNSGTIQESELAAAFTQMGYRLSPDFVRYLMSIADSEGNRQDGISVDQFIVLCIQIQKFTDEFRKRDVNQTGSITIGFEEFLGVAMSCSG